MCVTVLADSYFRDFRIKDNLVNGEIDLKHKSNKTVKLVNLSQGSWTFEKLVNDKTILSQWVDSRPRITVIHLGAVDLINRSVTNNVKTVKKYFVNLIETTVEKLRELARTKIPDFESWNKDHIFLVAQLPDWNNYKGRDNSLKPEDYMQVRRLINKELKTKRGILFSKRNILTVHPEVVFPSMHGVHYDPASQKEYIEQFLMVIRKLLCEECRPAKTTSTKALGLLRNTSCLKN